MKENRSKESISLEERECRTTNGHIEYGMSLDLCTISGLWILVTGREARPFVDHPIIDGSR
jgi:hypothetical protein